MHAVLKQPLMLITDSDRPLFIFITDTDYLHVYVPDICLYAEPIFIYCYKVDK